MNTIQCALRSDIILTLTCWIGVCMSGECSNPRLPKLLKTCFWKPKTMGPEWTRTKWGSEKALRSGPNFPRLTIFEVPFTSTGLCPNLHSLHWRQLVGVPWPAVGSVPVRVAGWDAPYGTGAAAEESGQLPATQSVGGLMSGWLRWQKKMDRGCIDGGFENNVPT